MSHIKKFAQVAILTIAISGVIGVSQAADIFSNTITGEGPGLSNPFTIGQTFDSNITVSGIGRGTGVTGNGTADDRYTGTSWNTVALDTDAYFTWTLTPSSGFEIDFTSFVYTGQASGTGPTSFSFRSSVDAFASEIGTPTVSGSTVVLTAAAFQNVTTAIEFRFYAWGASGSSGTFSVNDFTFNGSVSASAVPEPSTFALLAGTATLGLAAFRRRSRPVKAANLPAPAV